MRKPLRAEQHCLMAVDALTFILKMLPFGVTLVQQVGATRCLIAHLIAQQGGATRYLIAPPYGEIRGSTRYLVAPPCCTNTKGPISIIGNCKQGKDKGQLAISCNQLIRSVTRRKGAHKVQIHVP